MENYLFCQLSVPLKGFDEGTINTPPIFFRLMIQDSTQNFNRKPSPKNRFPISPMINFASLIEIKIQTENSELATNLSNVGFHVEVSEEDDEGDHVDDEDVVHPQRKLAASPDAVDTEDQGAGELDLEGKGRY